MSYRASPPPVDRMSFVSYGSLNENGMQYIGIAARSGLRPYCASSSAARSSASGCLPELLAGLRRTRRQRTRRRMPVEVALAGDRSFAADVEHAERAQLLRVRDADRHAELLLHGRVGGGRLHPAELDRRRLARIAGRQARRGRDRRFVFAVVGQHTARRSPRSRADCRCRCTPARD